MIDGLDGVEAAYYFAGIVGIHPKGLTLRRLFRMACGRMQQRRVEMLEQSALIWGADLDLDLYIKTGRLEPTGRGGPVQLSPDLQAKVDQRVREIQQENPAAAPLIRTIK